MRDPTSKARVSSPESERWLGPLSCALILLTPFVVFIRHHGYPLASPEFLMSAGVLTVAALAIGALAATHSVLLRVVAIGSFVVLLIDIQTEWITSWWWALTALVPPVLLGWLVRQRVARLGISHQLLLPVLDLIGVNVEVLGELGQGSVPSHGCHRYLRLEARRMIASFPLGHLLLLCLDGNVVQKIPLSSVDQLSNRWGPPLRTASTKYNQDQRM